MSTPDKFKRLSSLFHAGFPLGFNLLYRVCAIAIMAPGKN